MILLAVQEEDVQCAVVAWIECEYPYSLSMPGPLDRLFMT